MPETEVKLHNLIKELFQELEVKVAVHLCRPELVRADRPYGM